MPTANQWASCIKLHFAITARESLGNSSPNRGFRLFYKHLHVYIRKILIIAQIVDMKLVGNIPGYPSFKWSNDGFSTDIRTYINEE